MERTLPTTLCPLLARLCEAIADDLGAWSRSHALVLACSNPSSSIVYRMQMFPRVFVLMALLSVAHAGTAQDDTLTTAPWLDHEFRYWQGDPMMHGPNGECIAGYTDEERVLRFFRDGRYQEVIFEDRGRIMVHIWYPGDCDPLQGDTVALLTGTWAWANDTLQVTVERTAQYPLEVLLEVYMKRDPSKPFEMAMRPVRVCNTERERRFWFEGDRLAEAMRTWN